MRKRTKKKNHSYDDSLSQLPNDILTIILSSLTLKEAGRTSVLSSRWINLWKHTSRLNFEAQRALERIQEHPSLLYIERHNYVNWLNRILQLSKVPALKEFNVRFDLDRGSGNSIRKWLRYAFSHHVERLELNFLSPVNYVSATPYIFPNPEQLLCQCSVNTVQPPYDFKPLKIFSLKGVNVSAEDLKFFLDNCPFLDKMAVWHSNSLINLEVSGPSLKLKFLELHHCLNLKSLKVCNTNLVSLSVVRSLRSVPMLFLEKLPSLVDVSIVFPYSYISIRKVSSLLSCCLLQLEALKVFIGDPGKITELLEFPKLTKLKKLVLGAYQFDKDDLLIGVVLLIRSTPCLQEFVLELDWGGCIPAPARIVRSRSGIKFKRAERYRLQFLKVVKISGFAAQDSEFELIRYFVEYAVALERIIIKPRNVFKELRDLAKEFEGELPQHIDLVIL